MKKLSTFTLIASLVGGLSISSAVSLVGAAQDNLGNSGTQKRTIGKNMPGTQAEQLGNMEIQHEALMGSDSGLAKESPKRELERKSTQGMKKKPLRVKPGRK